MTHIHNTSHDTEQDVGSKTAAQDWFLTHDPLWVCRWDDSLVPPNAKARYVDGPYVDKFWLPILGPSAMFFLRRLAKVAEAGGGLIPLQSLAHECGLSRGPNSSPTRNSAEIRTLVRLTQFGCARPVDTRLEVRTYLSVLNDRQIARLPQHLQVQHVWATEGSDPDKDQDER